MKDSLRSLRQHLRRFLGIEEQRAQLEKHRQLLLEAISLLKHSIIEPDRVKASNTYLRCARVVSLLAPMDVEGGRFIRIGNDFDGGYVMLDQGLSDADAAYSIGISNDVSWDEAIAALGPEVYMFDHTIAGLPRQNPRFHFFKTGLTGHRKASDLATLDEILARNGHAASRKLILKMDIEACEWDVLDQTSTETLSQFSQIVLEIHELCPVRSEAHHASVLKGLTKLALTHQCIHVHANINCTPLWIGDIVLPDLMEVTYVRRSDVEHRLRPNTRHFPTPLDQPTYAGLPDLDLGRFSAP